MKVDEACLRLKAAGSKKITKKGQLEAKAKATMLLKTIMAAMALAAYFGYVLMMYPITQSIPRTVPAPKIAAPMFLPMKVSV